MSILVFLIQGEKEEYLRPIGQIFGLSDRTDIPVYEGEELEEEMIVMAGFNRMQIDNMLGGFRKNGVGTINIKAILTPTRRWIATSTV